MPTSADSRVLLNNGTEMTGYPTVGLPNGPTNDPLTADDKLNPQLPARGKIVSLLPNPTNSPTVLRLTWAVDKNVTDPLGWSHSAPGGSLPPSYIDSWSSPMKLPGLPAPDSFNVYSVTRDKYSGLPTYSFVANVSGSTFHYDATLPTLPGTYEYTVTGVSTPSGALVGGEGPFPVVNPQYVIPAPTDSVIVTNPGSQTNVIGDTGYPTVGLPNGPTNDPLTADDKLNPQLPARVKIVSLLPNPTNSPTVLRLTWAVDKNVTDPLGWSHSAPGGSLPPSYIDSWSSPMKLPGLPAPDSFNVYSVTRDKYSGLPTYSFVANVSGSMFYYDATLPTLPGTYEYTITGVTTPSGSLVGGEGPYPVVNPQYVIPAPTDSVIVTTQGSQTNVIGDTVNLTITASGTASGTLHYTATGLPHGLTLNLTSGIITGTPDVPVGTPVTVIVTVKNTVTGAAGQQSFAW